MKIAINTRLLLKDRLDGIGWFTYESLKRITQNHPEHQFQFIFDRPYAEEFIFSDNIEPIVIGPPTRHPILYYLYFEWRLPALLKKIQPDLFLSTDGYLSLRNPYPSLAVIHDINFHHFPQDLPWAYNKYYNHYFPRFAQKAKRIATVSNYSKEDIAKAYNIPLQKIDVVYNGVNEMYNPTSPTQQRETRQKYTNGKPYFLFVGTLLARKNIARLLEGFDRFKQQQESDVQLLIVGNKKWWTDKMEQAYQAMKHPSSVQFLSYLQPADLQNIMGAALAKTFVPIFEGFGIPIVEAMQCELPVLTSDASATKEVAQDACLLVDPYNTEAIAAGMSRLYNEPQLRQQLIQKGKKRVQDFSWDLTAKRLWSSIEKTIHTK